MKVQAIRLVTGQELIAEVVSTSDQEIVVKDALVLIVGRTPNGQIAVNFMPWTIVTESAIGINRASVISVYDVSKEVESSYIQNTTGIQVVPSGSVPQIITG